MWTRARRVILIYLFVFGTWFVVEPLTVHACSCAEPPNIKDQLNQKTAIFKGKVLSLTKPVIGKIWSSADPVKAQFEVKTVWKGELSSQTTVYTALSSASCGYEGFEVNEEYIVFASGDPERLETGLCEGTMTLASADEELKALGGGYEPSNITIPQADNRSVMIVLFLVISLTLFILLVISVRRRRR
ncbi:hypothetical protein GCM10008018_54070 [Paenibacillus marchantiophytorum]|uniref:Tissue inhibitor of metalloproteinase n=1 Tax=Paenibacillus marchantiophytorum TaxID=1619310 RepID=A0ABQ1F6R3_9BACL|nr:hypothetical protein [Paenibacillus marchantiophytorum]GGA00981.1 hypothetical protein GCM10008018_54070 [Paenibacillus marchantiophytorum]